MNIITENSGNQATTMRWEKSENAHSGEQKHAVIMNTYIYVPLVINHIHISTANAVV